MRLVYNKLSLEAITLIEDSNSITCFPSEIGVIEGDKITIEKTVIALGINILNINGLTMTPDRISVLKKQNKGNEIVRRFLEENESIVISTQDNINQLTAFLNIKVLLESGALATARDILTTIPADHLVLTPGYQTKEERKQSYIDEINGFLDTFI